jgi:serine/threonine protein kinase
MHTLAEQGCKNVKRNKDEPGGWSRVYEALDDTLNRTVAFKVLHPYYVVDSHRLERFRREVESASILSHANVAAVYDFGQLPNGRPFIVMSMRAIASWH